MVFSFFFFFCGLLFGLQLVFQSMMSDLLFSSTPAPPNLLLDSNLNMNLIPETTVLNDTLYEPISFEPVKGI